MVPKGLMNVCGSNISPRNITENVIGELKYELFKNEFVYVGVQRVFQFIMENLIDIWIDSEHRRLIP